MSPELARFLDTLGNCAFWSLWVGMWYELGKMMFLSKADND